MFDGKQLAAELKAEGSAWNQVSDFNPRELLRAYVEIIARELEAPARPDLLAACYELIDDAGFERIGSALVQIIGLHHHFIGKGTVLAGLLDTLWNLPRA